MGFQVVLVDELPMEFSRKFRRKRVFFPSITALVIFLLKIILKIASKKFFFRPGIKIGFEPTITDAVARSSIVFLQISLCRSHCSRWVTLASCLSFAAGLRQWFWSGCMNAAIVICQQIFSILALVIFLLKMPLKVLQNHPFFALASRSGFGATISHDVVPSSLCFATPSPQIALEWLRQGCFLLQLHG